MENDEEDTQSPSHSSKFFEMATDNAGPHTSAATKQFFERRNVSLVLKSPYSPDFKICDRWLFHELKRRLGTEIYSSHTEIEEATKKVFHDIPE